MGKEGRHGNNNKGHRAEFFRLCPFMENHNFLALIMKERGNFCALQGE